MTIRTNQYPVPDLIFPQNILVSTFDKSDLEVLVESILTLNKKAVFYSTGGTGTSLRKIMGSQAATNYLAVEEFTGCPEMDGGLVKTLHPKIHAGLLAERGNPHHEAYLLNEMSRFGRGPGVYFDIFVGNLYPFNDVVQKEGGSAEVARCYIDIGGPCMTMAAAKNWHSVTVLTYPGHYAFLRQILHDDGGVSVDTRFRFAVDAMETIAKFRNDNYNHFRKLDFNRDILPTIKIAD